MISFDTNVVVHSANVDSDHFPAARDFLQQMAGRTDVVMPEVWKWTRRKDFAIRRIIDVRLGLTLRHFDVKEFATTNSKDFRALGFRRVWNPLS